MSHNFTDPAHFKSDNSDCSWCGAKWNLIDGQMVMNHQDNCSYIDWCKNEDLIDEMVQQEELDNW